MYSKDQVCSGEGNMNNKIRKGICVCVIHLHTLRAGQGETGHSRQNGQVVKYIKLGNTSYVLIFKWRKK